jgi:hypothetical protein
MEQRIQNCKIKTEPISELDKFHIIYSYYTKSNEVNTPDKLIKLLKLLQFQYRLFFNDLRDANAEKSAWKIKNITERIREIENDIDKVQQSIKGYKNQ